MRTTAVCLIVLFALSMFATAQSIQPSTAGLPPNAIAMPVSYGSIDGISGNLHLEIPLVSRPTRGAVPFQAKLVYDSSSIYSYYSNSWQANTGTNIYGGWSLHTSADPWVERGALGNTYYCYDSLGHPKGAYGYKGGYYYVDNNGTEHYFPASINWDGGCGQPVQTSSAAVAYDGSGYMVINNGQRTVWNSSGVQVYPSVRDSNGNTYTKDADGNVTDPTGKQIFQISKPSADEVSYTYYDGTSKGHTSTITVTLAHIQVSTWFSVSGLAEYTGQITVISSIRYPNDDVISFDYGTMASGAPHEYGALVKITLPQGGVETFTYGPQRDWGGAPIQYSERYVGGKSWTVSRTIDDSNNPKVVANNPDGSSVRYSLTILNNTNWTTGVSVISSSGAVASTTATTYQKTCTDGNCVRPKTVTSTLVGAPSQVTTYDYDGNLRPKSIKQFDFGQDASGTPLKQTDISYASNLPPQFLDRVDTITISGTTGWGGAGEAAKTQYVYDANGNSIDIKRWKTKDGTSPTWIDTVVSYDSYGNVTSVRDPGGHSTQTSYTCDGSYPEIVTYPSTTDADGSLHEHKTSTTYDCLAGLPISVTDMNGNPTTFEYDRLNRPTKTSYVDGAYSATNYASPTLIENTQTSGDGKVPTVRQTLSDDRGRIIATGVQVALSRWQQSDTCYDVMGRVTFRSLPHETDGEKIQAPSSCSGAGDTYSYDVLGRPLSVQHPDGSALQYSYTGRAVDIVSETNGNSRREKVLQSNGLGSLGAVCDVTSNTPAAGGVAPSLCGLDISKTGLLTTYSYDVASNLLSATQPGGLRRTRAYDSLSQVVSESLPEAGVTLYEYDADGLLTVRTRPAPNNESANTVDTTYSYDALHRLLHKGYTFTKTTEAEPNTPPVNFQYDQTSANGLTLANTNGQLTMAWTGTENIPVAGGTGTLYSYDRRGRLDFVAQCTPATCGSSWYTSASTYDLGGNLSESTVPKGVSDSYKLTYKYDVVGRLISLSSSFADASHPAQLLSSAQYNRFGLLSRTFGNHVVETRAYGDGTNGILGALIGISAEASNDNSTAAPSTGTVTIVGSLQSQPGQPATSGSGSVSVSGVEQSTQVKTADAVAATGSVNISGSERSTLVQYQCGQYAWCSRTEYDYGTITVTVNGLQKSVGYSNSPLGGALSNLASAFNTDSSSPVIASVSGSAVTFTTKTAGVAGNGITLLASSRSTDTAYFSGTSYYVSTSGSTLTGGKDTVYTTTYDAGTASVTVAGRAYNVSWSNGSTPSSIATAISKAINNDTSSVVSASASGTTLSLRAKSTGAATNYPLSAGLTYDTAHFSNSSFTLNTSGARLTGGQDAGGTTIYDSGSASITVNGHTNSYAWSGPATTSSSIAIGLASAINADLSALVTATASGNTITISSKASGSETNYSLLSGTTYDSINLGSPSFTMTNSGASLSGGADAGSTPVYSLTLNSASNGFVQSVNDSVSGKWQYSYDEFNRLLSASRGTDPNSLKLTWDYDAYGNRWNQNASGTSDSSAYQAQLTMSQNSQIQGVTYDKAGHVIKDKVYTYRWDAEGKLVAVNDGSTATYVYNAAGDRVSGPTYEYVRAGSTMTVFDKASGQWLRSEIYAGGHLATYTPDGTYFIHPDYLGNERVRTDVAGNVCYKMANLPYGDTQSTPVSACGTANGQTFALLDRDPETGLFDTPNRKYSSTSGRWLTPDPAYWAAVDLSDPSTLNPYTYVRNNPSNYIDPDGTSDNWWGWGSFSGYAGPLSDIMAANITSIRSGVGISGPSAFAASQEAEYAKMVASAQPSSSCGFFCRLVGRIANALTGRLKERVTHKLKPVSDDVLPTTVPVQVSPFGNTVVQAGVNASYFGGGLSYVPSTGNFYLSGSAGSKSPLSVYAGAGPTSNLDQSGLFYGWSVLYPIGAGSTWSPTGDRTDFYGFSVPFNWSVAGGWSYPIGSIAPAVFDVNLPAIPSQVAVPIGEGLYTYDDNVFVQ